MLQAKQRLLAWRPNKVSTTSLWKQYLGRGEIDPYAFLEDGQKVGKLGTFLIVNQQVPNSAYAVLDVVGDDVTTVLAMFYEEGRTALDIQECVVVVNPKYQGRGLAFKFYEWLLTKYRTLTSDDSLSAGASKLWSRLITKHRGHIRLVHGTEVHEIAIHGFEERNGFVWPLVERAGIVTSLADVQGSKEKAARESFTYVLRR